MDDLIAILRTDTFLIFLLCAVILLFIGFIIMVSKLSSINKKYKKFIKKLGNGKDIEEDLENYIKCKG